MKRLLALSLVVLLPASGTAASPVSGASFLKIGTGARPAALGGAYTAMARDVDAIYYNPGGLAALSQREFGATHAEWLLNTRFDFLGYAQPTSVGTFGLGVTRLASGGFEGRSATRGQTSGFTAADTAYAVSFARGFTKRTGLGVSLKYLRSEIAGYSAQTVAFDFGAQRTLTSRPITLGLSVLNVGRPMTFLDQSDPLPLTFAVGAAYRAFGTLNIALDVRHEAHDGRLDVGVGTEYAILPSFSLRAGYASQFDGAPASSGGMIGSLGGLGAGFGLRMKSYRMDYTFTPFGELGNVQRLSLGARFGR